jgi:hypothetical protein
VFNDRDVTERARRLANELSDCRQRGIERLDIHTHNQRPVAAAELDRLAQAHVASRQLGIHGRTAQIKLLLWDAVAAMEQQEAADAALVRELFFGDLPHLIEPHAALREPGWNGMVRLAVVQQSAGELFDQAKRKSGLTQSRFRDRRTTAFGIFSEFLAEFGAGGDQAPADTGEPAADRDGQLAVRREEPGAPATHGTNGQADPGLVIAEEPKAEAVRHPLRTGHVDDAERFTQLLAEAVNATIVGFTNENLTAVLENALARKRVAMNDPDVFWRSLRIVFFSDALLDSIIDERPEYPDRRDALRQRRLAAVSGRRSVQVFLRRITADRWTLYESPFVPPLVGTLFEMPDGRRVMHLLIRHPQRSPSDHLYLEVDETSDQYFTAVIEDIVHNSISDNKIVAVGHIRGETFHRTGTRYRHNVLRAGSGSLGWLPYVLVVTWRQREGKAEPFLQLRSTMNSARDLNRLTHVATHIFQEDYDDSPDGAVPVPPATFDLEHPAPRRAGRRRVYMEAGEELPGELAQVTASQYLHYDREHLFFLIYTLRVPGDFHFPRRAEMHHVPMPELLAICQNQALRKAELLLRAPAMPRWVWTRAIEIASLNLILHGHAELGDRLRTLGTQRQAQRDDIASVIRALIEETGQTWFSAGREVDVLGLSGLHYREFFTLLLPLYAELGVPGAAEHLAQVTSDEAASAAIARLAELYTDEELMMAIPVEL